jgi:lysophospholipase L1-like esterase
MRRLAGCLLLVLLISACSDAPPEIPRLAPDAVIVAFGDSLTAGNGVSRERAYPAVLAELSGRQVVNAGVPGEQSGAGRERLPGVLDRYRPQLLLLCHGGNDLLRKKNETALADNLRDMINEARDRGIPVVLIGVPRPKLLFMEAAPLYAELAEELAVPYEADILPMLESDQDYKSDAIHLNAEGYRLLAVALQALLVEAGALGD